MPVIRSKSVVLPAPVGPITETISPSSTCRSRSETDLQTAERERDALQLEQGRASDDLHATLAEEARSAADHEADQHGAEHDVRLASGWASSTFSHTNAPR